MGFWGGLFFAKPLSFKLAKGLFFAGHRRVCRQAYGFGSKPYRVLRGGGLFFGGDLWVIFGQVKNNLEARQFFGRAKTRQVMPLLFSMWLIF